MTTQTPIEREEMRAIRRDIINQVLHENYICKGKRFPSFKGLRGYIRMQEYLSFDQILSAYKGFKP